MYLTKSKLKASPCSKFLYLCIDLYISLHWTWTNKISERCHSSGTSFMSYLFTFNFCYVTVYIFYILCYFLLLITCICLCISLFSIPFLLFSFPFFFFSVPCCHKVSYCPYYSSSHASVKVREGTSYWGPLGYEPLVTPLSSQSPDPSASSKRGRIFKFRKRKDSKIPLFQEQKRWETQKHRKNVTPESDLTHCKVRA